MFHLFLCLSFIIFIFGLANAISLKQSGKIPWQSFLLLLLLFTHEEIIEDAKVAHREILEALKARDGIRCYHAVSKHLIVTEEHIENLYKNSNN